MIVVITGVCFRYSIVMQTGCTFIICCQFFYFIPDFFLIRSFIAFVTDINIVIKRLTCVCKAGFIFCPIIDVSCPAVGIDTDNDIDLCHFQRAADIPDLIISGTMFLKLCAAGCDCCFADIAPALVHIVVFVSELD